MFGIDLEARAEVESERGEREAEMQTESEKKVAQIHFMGLRFIKKDQYQL